MKRKNLIKLFSVALCVSTLFAGCKGGEESSSSSVNFGAADPIEAIRSNFLSFQYVQEWKEYCNTSILTETYGTFVDSYKEVYVFKKLDKDFLNNVTETFTVYNANKGEVVLTLENKYADANYGEEDKFENEKHAPTEMVVSARNVSGIPYVAVETYTYTRLDDELIEKEELEESYDEKYKVEYYDVAGTKLTESNLPTEVKSRGATANKQKVLFGRTVVMLDKETHEKISSWDAEKDSVHSLFTYENDWYGYYIPMMGTSGSAIEVYDKKDKLVLRYDLEDEGVTSAYPLQSGNMILQKLKQTTAASYDFEMEGLRFDMQTLILDVKTGTTQEIEFDYYLAMGVYTSETLAAETDGEMTFTENVVNFGGGFKVENAPLNDSNMAGVFFDNVGNVQYVTEKMYPEHSGFEAEKLAYSGYYLIEIDSPVADEAIVNEYGELICYVPRGASVVGNYILKNNALYDFSLNCDYEFTFMDEEIGWTYRGMVGNKLLFTREYTYEDQTTYYYDSCTVDVSDYSLYTNHLGNGRFVEIDSNGNYVVFENSEGEYELYNAHLQQVLTTKNAMEIQCFEKTLIVETTLNGKEERYAIRTTDVDYGY